MSVAIGIVLHQAKLISALAAVQSKHVQFDCHDTVDIKTDTLVPLCYECEGLCMHSADASYVATANASHAGPRYLQKMFAWHFWIAAPCAQP